MHLALDVLEAHDADRIPHVPIHAVCLLAAALLYYLDPVDVIPDFVEGAGTIDDRLVMAFAHAEGAGGIARYEAWAKEAGLLA